MNNAWKRAVENALNSAIDSMTPVGGGDFARAFSATLSNQTRVFIKTHENPPAHFFTTEATGLEWLRSAKALNVPKVLAVSDDPPFLAMEWIEIGAGTHSTEVEFGQALAQLHQRGFKQVDFEQVGFEYYGRPDGRTTGSLGVPNEVCESWPEFYSSKRLLPLAKLAHDRQALPEGCVNDIELLCQKLGEFGAADEAACLLHGDLWAGNRVVDINAQSWIIDPAAHGGHREFDLAMMQLFGGYDAVCFEAYNEVFALESGWRSRVALHQLAPLIVHAIKFGGSYGAATKRALKHYV